VERTQQNPYGLVSSVEQDEIRDGTFPEPAIKKLEI